MSTSVAELDIQPPKQSAFGAGFARMDNTQKTRMGLGAVALLGIILALFFMGREPDWRVLYTSLNDKDGGAIVAQLTQMNVPYKYTEGGQAIMVPSDKVHDTRLRLPSLGLPKGSVSGFELMESTSPDGDVAKFIDKRGEGVMLISFNVDNTREAMGELVQGLVADGNRTITFCRSRRGTELVAADASRRLPKIADRIRPYRGGYLSAERREIEEALAMGEVDGVVTTTALELGVDLDGLDAVVVNGFPGTIASFWQQVGRAGRDGRTSLGRRPSSCWSSSPTG